MRRLVLRSLAVVIDDGRAENLTKTTVASRRCAFREI